MARGVDDKMSFMEHLGELRVRIVRSLYALLAGSVPGLYFSQQIVDWLARYQLATKWRRAPTPRPGRNPSRIAAMT